MFQLAFLADFKERQLHPDSADRRESIIQMSDLIFLGGHVERARLGHRGIMGFDQGLAFRKEVVGLAPHFVQNDTRVRMPHLAVQNAQRLFQRSDGVGVRIPVGGSM